MKTLYATLLTTSLLVCISEQALGGSLWDERNEPSDAYRRQRDYGRDLEPQTGPSRPWNYRDEEGFQHRCRQYGNIVNCED